VIKVRNISLRKAAFYFANISGGDVVACISALTGELVVLEWRFDLVKSGIANSA
jgi:hypothetical protein